MACTDPVGLSDKLGNPTKRPCGTCMDCRLEYSRQWAVRCYHEAQMHEDTSFLTLTYNDDKIPKDGSVSRKELQNFMKRLRSELEKPVRFFGCGEYGENYFRPHYHLCLFGYDFPDKEIFQIRNRKKGYSDMLYISEMLGRIWTKGFHTIGEVNFKTAGYTARYITKKHFGKGSDFMYDGLEPEFALMSRGQKKGGKGGIGKPFFEKYWRDIYPKDFITINGRKHKPPKFYDSLLEKKDLHMYQYVKACRENEAFKQLPESSKELWLKNRYREKVTSKLEREI